MSYTITINTWDVVYAWLWIHHVLVPAIVCGCCFSWIAGFWFGTIKIKVWDSREFEEFDEWRV